jgi:hypothetical protein
MPYTTAFLRIMSEYGPSSDPIWASLAHGAPTRAERASMTLRAYMTQAFDGPSDGARGNDFQAQELDRFRRYQILFNSEAYNSDRASKLEKMRIRSQIEATRYELYVTVSQITRLT